MIRVLSCFVSTRSFGASVLSYRHFRDNRPRTQANWERVANLGAPVRGGRPLQREWWAGSREIPRVPVQPQTLELAPELPVPPAANVGCRTKKTNLKCLIPCIMRNA